MKINPNDFFAHFNMTLINACQNRMEEACAHASELLRITPHFSLKVRAGMYPSKDKGPLNWSQELLRKVGMPER